MNHNSRFQISNPKSGIWNRKSGIPAWNGLALGLAVAAAALLASPSPAPAQDAPGTVLQKVGFDQNLDAQLPLDLAFRDESGREVRLGDYFGRRPVLLMLVYYRCPLLCGQEVRGLARSLKPLSLDPGRDFEVVAVSIAPDETPELAAHKKAAYMDFYSRPGTEKGWHFLTGRQPEIDRLARTVGFRYTFNPASRLYTHAAGLVVATPSGRLSRYVYGIDFSPRDLQFALTESSAGKIGSPIARLLLLCYHYDAATGKYTLAIVNILRVLGTATALALAAYMVAMLRKERRARAGSGPLHSPLEPRTS